MNKALIVWESLQPKRHTNALPGCNNLTHGPLNLSDSPITTLPLPLPHPPLPLCRPREMGWWIGNRSLAHGVAAFKKICALFAVTYKCVTLQRTATLCNTLQHTVACCKHPAIHCTCVAGSKKICTSYTATQRCVILPHVASFCNTLQRAATHCNTLQHTAYAFRLWWRYALHTTTRCTSWCG